MFGLLSIKKVYENNSVSVCGKKGRGKDILTANVIARRAFNPLTGKGRKYYISNVDYKVKNCSFIEFDPSLLRVGNSYENFIENKVKKYIYPYPDGTDIYLSDCGIYFPSQYNGELNRKYKDIPTFMALSRQLGDCYVHTNAQALNRVWDKIREQSDIYISCQSCKVLFNGKLVIQKVRLYEKYESAVANVPPCRIAVPIFNLDRRQKALIARDQYMSTYGKIETKYLIYLNKSNYDTRLFKKILERGDSDEKDDE